MAKYGVLSLYYIDFDKRYSIDDDEIHFVKGYGYALIGYPDHPYGTSTDHEYFFILDDLLGRILETDQNLDIVLKVIHREVSISSINDNSTYSRSKLRSRFEIVYSHHHLQRRIQKQFHDYSQKMIDDLKLIVVNPSPKLTDK